MSSRFLAVLGILLGMSVLAVGWSSINMSLSSLQDDLGATIFQLQWMMNLYGIAICIALLPIGKLGDAYGRKKFYMAGLAGLIVACLIAGTSQSMGPIIAAMGLFGLSGASVLALSQALTVLQFPENQKSKAIAIWATVTSIALSMGPLVGGAILKYLSWRWVFLVNIPIAFLALFFVFLFVKKEKNFSVSCDWSGVAFLSILIGGAIGAVMQGPNWGWSSPGVIGLFLLAALALTGLVLVEKKGKTPLFQANLFAHRSFLYSSIANGCLLGFIWAIFFFVPFYLQNLGGRSPLQAGCIMLFITLPTTFLSIPVSRLYEKVGARPLLFSGFSLLLTSVLFHIYIPIELLCLMIGCGWALTWGPSTSRALVTLPHNMAGVASGMFMTLQEIGGVVGLTMAGVVFRTGIRRFLNPQMHVLEETFKEQTNYILSDPTAAKELINPDAPILGWLYQGFKVGYNQTLLSLSVLMVGGLICSFLLPKLTKATSKS